MFGINVQHKAAGLVTLACLVPSSEITHTHTPSLTPSLTHSFTHSLGAENEAKYLKERIYKKNKTLTWKMFNLNTPIARIVLF